MSETMEYVHQLSREIGPRPAGTEEERAAAEYIAAQIEATSGLEVEMEDFNAPAGGEMPRVICAAIAVVAGILSLISPIFAIVAVILLLISAALTIAEYLGHPLLEKILSRGVSQNVVAKYKPSFIYDEGRGRKRKVVVIAHYDSGKVRGELRGGLIKALPVVQKVYFWAPVAMLVLVFIRSIILGGDSGAAGTFFGVLVVISIIASIVPLVFAIMHKTAAFSEAANANAAGVAALMEVAGRVGRGRMSEEEIAHLAMYDNQPLDDDMPIDQAPVVHGAEAAFAANVVPEGADVIYEAQPTPVDFAEASSEGGLDAAKAAIAALTGKPIVSSVQAVERVAPVAAEGVGQIIDEAAEAVPAEPVSAPIEPAYVSMSEGAPAVPAWFAAAQAKAKKAPQTETQAKRSRYADALDAAASVSSARFVAADQQETVVVEEPVAQVEQVEQAVQAVQAEQLNEKAVETPAPDNEEKPKESPAPRPARVGRGVQALFEGMSESLQEHPVEKGVEEPSFLNTMDAAREISPNRVVVSAYTDEVEIVDESTKQPEESPESNVEDANQAPVEPEPAAPPASDFVMGITSEFDAITPDSDSPSLSKKLPVVLPQATGSFAPVDDSMKQRAPLADSSSRATAKSLLSMLPSIDPLNPNQESTTVAEEDVAENEDLGKSGTIPAIGGAGSAGATGVFAPVTSEMVAAAKDEEDLFIEDADDSDYQENFTESGAFAGPDYVEMPKSPVKNLLDRLFHRKDTSEQETRSFYEPAMDEGAYYDEPQGPVSEPGADWDNGYDDDLFEDDYYDYDEPQTQDGVDDQYNADDRFNQYGEKWNGGAFSALKDRATEAAAGVASRVRREDPEGAMPEQEPEQAPERRRGRFSSMIDEQSYQYANGAMPPERPRREPVFEEVQVVEPETGEATSFEDAEPEHLEEAREAVQQFRNPFINAEVWFVALGSDLAGNAGMKAFLDAHASDLRGSIIIELDALGVGQLSLVETEGTLKKTTVSSRMKRYLRKVAQTTGITTAKADFGWNDSASSYANSHGFSAMHLAGVEDGKPALFAQIDDTIENVDEQTLQTNVECVMELLRTI